ncbi:MAG: RagB/SusD family nutrient uptake outer membrane protein, partial [Muribaculaceae bacterium]|nr:RagB/SusD family nutrient uptake outer membrane protein [Muribaculaceae bacterium]
MLETSSELVEFEKDNTLNHPTDSVYSVLGIIGKMQVIADRTVILGEVRGDLMTPTDAASADLKNLAAFNFSAENKYNTVSDYYAVINNCNYYLAHVDTALQRRGRTLFTQEFAAVKAFRAWTYLQLAQVYGQVPLVLNPVMTEQEARDAMNQPRVDINAICQYFIDDLTPVADTELPRFGNIDSWDSQTFFIPMKALLGDLCLWAGQYQDAARWYNSYLNDQKTPISLNYTSRIVWPNATDFQRPQNGYSVTSTREVVSLVPMEQRIFDGVVSDLPNIFTSTRENNYYYQLTPSSAMHRLSAAQTYCMENKTATTTDTIYVPKTGLPDDILAGDLRFYANYSLSPTPASLIDNGSEGGSRVMQSISKVWSGVVPLYRRTMVYLRYAEALNRAGFPQTAFAVLKYGLCSENLNAYVDATEQAAVAPYAAFDENVFTRETTIGIHSLGSGDSQANELYALPMPASQLATRGDTVQYQIPLVEDLIVNEMALEGAFEGYR